jgi:serine/threonine protein kinase
LILELAVGGDLLEYVVANKKLDEKEAVRIIRQIISALEYLHSHFIIHRGKVPRKFLMICKI